MSAGMAGAARMAIPALSVASGLLMVGSVAVGSHGAAMVGCAAALTAVAVGTALRPAATFAVVLVVFAIALSGPPPVPVGLSGLCAAAYLVSRHATGPSAAMVIGSRATWVAALCFTSAGLIAVSFPLQLPWLPLLAPLGALAIFVLATRPFT
ncbi:hypothetical protein AB8998_22645 [Mycobacterium sp. HUMS_12744610]|uniref:Integral membrane protein n=2 Tax=Mycobacterium servetii TaxID=3237418 RepID=A0ABV4C4V3_9MYCO